jgi:hypothetical protein
LPTIYYPIRGFDEPIAVPIFDAVFTREQRRAHAAGATGAFTVLGTVVTVTHERGSLAEDGVLAVQANPAKNLWRATGRETRAQLQRAVGDDWRLTVVGVDESHDGDAVRLDLEGTAYVASHSRQAIEFDLRGSLAGWRVAVIAGGAMTARRADDFVAQLFVDVDGAQTFGALELARDLRWGAVATGVSGASSAASGSVPAVAELLPVNQRLLAPMLAYEVGEARALAWWATGAYRVRWGTVLSSVRYETAAPAREVPELLQPSGTRTGWSVSLGVRY